MSITHTTTRTRLINTKAKTVFDLKDHQHSVLFALSDGVEKDVEEIARLLFRIGSQPSDLRPGQALRGLCAGGYAIQRGERYSITSKGLALFRTVSATAKK